MSDDSWLLWRSQGVGASDVAASWTGLYGGAYTVVAKKLGYTDPGIDPELADRGHRWEQPIADTIHTLTGLYIVGEQAWCEQSGAEHRRATVDGFLATAPEVTADDVEGVAEFKTVTAGAAPKWGYYEAQIQCQMFVTGTARGLLAVAVIDHDDRLVDLRFRWYDADPDLQTMLAAEYDRLWAYIQAGELPDPDSPAALDAVKQVTASSDPDAETVDLSDIVEQVAELGRLRQAVRDAETRRDELEALVRHRLGAATHGVCDGWAVTYSNPSRVLTKSGEEAILLAHPEFGRTVLDRAAAKTGLGKALDDFKEPAGARRLTIKEKK